MRANRRRHAPLVRCGYGVRDKRGLTVGAAGIRFKLKDLSSCSIMTIDQMAGDRCEHQTRHAGRQQHEVNHARLDEGECDTLLLIDPDHFSLINDKTRIFQR